MGRSRISEVFGYLNEPQPEKKKETIIEGKTDLTRNIIITGGVCAFGLGIGAAVGTQIFIAGVSVAGLYVIAETNPMVKKFIIKTNKWVDLALFGLSIYAIAHLGVTLAGSLAISGLFYSSVLAPYYRNQQIENKK